MYGFAAVPAHCLIQRINSTQVGASSVTDDVIEQLTARTDRIIADLQEEWGPTKTLEAVEWGPVPWHRDTPPDSVDQQVDEFAGMASVVVFRSEERIETVLVYHRSGRWEPPGGAIEGGNSPSEIAVMEAREEAGIEVELTDLLFIRPVEYHYADGSTVTFPAVTFLGREIDGDLRPERAESTHAFAIHGVGVFGRDVLPENCRDREHILNCFEGLPPYDPMPPELMNED